jgi:hypothetical protein
VFLTRTWAVSAIFLTQALLVYFLLGLRFPLSGDDHSYLYQSQLFAAGKIYAEDPLYDPTLPSYKCLRTICLRDDHGHRFSKYPPGWPALLAIGTKLNIPWLIDPLLGAALVFLIIQYVKRRMGEKWAGATSVLLLLCFFLSYYAGSMRAHIAAALFVFAAFLLYDAAQRRASPPKLWLFAVGAILGYSSIIRYVDWVPLGAWIGFGLLRRRRLADLIWFGVGFGVLASGNLIWDTLLMGHAFQLPATVNGLSGSTKDHLVVSWRGVFVTIVRLATLIWVFPPVFLLISLRRHYRLSSDLRMYLALFAMSVATYFFYPEAIGGPGPRYFLAYFPFLVLAIVELRRQICHDSPHVMQKSWNRAVIGLIVSSLVLAAEEGYTMHGRRDLERAVQRIGAGKKIILLKTGTFRTSAGDLTRNPPELSAADTLYLDSRACPQPELTALLERFSGRNVFVYQFPGHLDPYRIDRQSEH